MTAPPLAGGAVKRAVHSAGASLPSTLLRTGRVKKIRS